MMMLINTIIMSVVTGIVSGLISSVLVTRLSRFENLRSEAQRILRGLEYVQTENGGVEILRGQPDTTNLVHVASDFYALGHRNAGDAVNLLISDINRILLTPQRYIDIERADADWQSRGRDLRPNTGAIFKFNFQI